MPSWLGINWKTMWTWAEKWQRSSNVTKCKKTFRGNDLIRRSWVFNYNPGKELEMTENCFRKTSVLWDITDKTEKDWESKSWKNVDLHQKIYRKPRIKKGFLHSKLILDKPQYFHTVLVIQSIRSTHPDIWKWHNESRNSPEQKQNKMKRPWF